MFVVAVSHYLTGRARCLLCARSVEIPQSLAVTQGWML
jgi:hypothetical protein